MFLDEVISDINVLGMGMMDWIHEMDMASFESQYIVQFRIRYALLSNDVSKGLSLDRMFCMFDDQHIADIDISLVHGCIVGIKSLLKVTDAKVRVVIVGTKVTTAFQKFCNLCVCIGPFAAFFAASKVRRIAQIGCQVNKSLLLAGYIIEEENFWEGKGGEVKDQGRDSGIGKGKMCVVLNG
ncbi:hypothetical protein Tco_0921557 [Tanacetum coccineum]